MSKCLLIQELPPGKTARIVDLIGQPQRISRLCEIGIRVGAPLQMLQAGIACIVRVNGSKICLRPQGVQVMVEPH